MALRRSTTTLIVLAVATFLFHAATVAKEQDRNAKRARPPKWSQDVRDVFFEDARTELVGERPNYGSAMAAVKGSVPTPNNGDEVAAPSDAGWSKLIDAETIESEIKRLSQILAKDVTTPTAFKGGAYEDCRRHFCVLATLFAVAAEYDGDVRWQDSAPGLRQLFARAGYNCKVGNDQTFREATQRKQDLADLISGSRPKLPSAEKAAAWGEVADLAPLMQRLNIAHEERLTKWLANQRQFEQHADDIRHEAQLVAAIADVIGHEGFDYWGEDEYAQNVRELRESATDTATAVELNNYEQAQKAISRATKACAACHELYRG
jgi:hypothetical protein